MHVGRAVTRKNNPDLQSATYDISFLKGKHYTLDTRAVIVGNSSGYD